MFLQTVAEQEDVVELLVIQHMEEMGPTVAEQEGIIQILQVAQQMPLQQLELEDLEHKQELPFI
jgi:hypothetical protein